MKIFQAMELNRLFDTLHESGYDIVGPRYHNEAIIYANISSPHELPQGYSDEQEPQHYKLNQNGHNLYFDHAVGPQSWKKYLFPPQLKMFSTKREGNTFDIIPTEHEFKPIAFLGVRPCELAALHIQDKVFIEDNHKDSYYLKQREKSLLIAVNCTRSVSTCFCASMDTGPKAKEGYDISLTEVENDGAHYFLIDSKSKKGEAIINAFASKIPLNDASPEEIKVADNMIDRNAGSQKRSINKDNMKGLLQTNATSTQWDEIATRCLSCANCTLVCPTCFCSTVEDITDLTGDHSERWRKWESCFTYEFSTVHGKPVRSEIKSKYRQWMTHKLDTWHDQFGTSGCVGCGRCITWCPTGIDITAEAGKMELTGRNSK